MATWTSEEDKILIEIYETALREKILARLPNRIWRSIYKRSVILNLKRPKDDAWKKEDDDRLRELYPNTPWNVLITLFPGRTKKSIAWRAINILRLTRDYEIVQEENRKTNLARRGVEYPTQSADVRDKVKATVQKRYGVDNVFQSEDIKKKMKETNLEKFGVEHPNQNEDVREKSRQTNQERYGVDNPFQLRDKIRAGMLNKYGIDHPQKVPEIKEKTAQTNIERYGVPTPAQNPEIRKKLIEKLNTPEVREKVHESLKKGGMLKGSTGENNLFKYLKELFPDSIHHILHPILKQDIDFYIPSLDLWGQYDGDYWHNLKNVESIGPQRENIKKGALRDKIQNENIPNLIRFYESEFNNAVKDNNVMKYINEVINGKKEELKEFQYSSHQYKKKIQYYAEDLNNLPFNPDNLKASDFDLSVEELSDEIIGFIERYEWLGNIGISPKWCFTARYKGFLGGAVLINEPTAYSKILGDDTQKYEALIQRGASASWTPKNLGSRLIIFSCKWMVQNTEKRAFVGYADLNANERGLIYRACNFEYLGDNFGLPELLKHPSFPRLFSTHSLKRTSMFIRWCRNNNILVEKVWLKENGFKNLKTIPSNVKQLWYDWNQKIISESEKIKIEKKMKFVLILGTNKRETKELKELRTYKCLEYSEEYKRSISNNINLTCNTGKTRSRKNTVKDQFIIDNYGKKTNIEIAKDLGETPRWVKRNLVRLTNQGKIVRLHSVKSSEELLTEEKWIPEIKNRAINLRCDYLKDKKEICEILFKEFSFKITSPALGFWFRKFKIPFPTKTEWLERFLSIQKIKEFLDKGFLRKDFVNYLKDIHEVYISEDIISLYIRSKGL